MSDAMVLKAQQWVNQTYGSVPGFIPAPETGKTGWATMEALIMGLQHELGMSSVVGSFGTATLNAVTTQYGTIDIPFTNTNVVKILQSGLYCKGYDGDAILGNYNARMRLSIASLRSDMGLPSDTSVTPKMFKAILNMDAYVLVSGGHSSVREVQRWLNSRYVGRRDFFIAPADGLFSRDVQKALLFAIQYELGLADGVANGNFGPTTQSLLKARPTLIVGSADGTGSPFVKLYHAALIFNTYSNPARFGEPVPLESTFSSDTASTTTKFQQFVGLPDSGQGNYQTWAALVASTGDPTRDVTALDTITQITAARATNLKNAGYKAVGRYLTNSAATNALNKKLQPGELTTIFNAGMSVFPIYQTYGGSASYFNATQGAADAIAAHDAAAAFGFLPGTTIYFAVDYDAWGDDIPVNIIPHFKAIKAAMISKGNRYNIGIYAPRNVCTRVKQEVPAVTFSFVSDMSTGFSGNLGYPLPTNWAFDQIATVTAHGLTFDKVVMSGRDPGATSVSPQPGGATGFNAQFLAYVDSVWDAAVAWKDEVTDFSDPEVLVAHYINSPTYDDVRFDLLFGEINDDWLQYGQQHALPRVEPVDPRTQTTLSSAHMYAAVRGYQYRGLPTTPDRATMADIGGWAGDFITFVGAFGSSGTTDAYQFTIDHLGAKDDPNSFGNEDLIEDADGFNLVKSGVPRIKIHNIASDNGTWATRFTEFVNGRFAGIADNARKAAESIFIGADFDISVIREALLFDYDLSSVDDDDVRDIARGFRDVLTARKTNEI